MINFSIIMPCYNSAEYVKKALDSIPRRDDIEVICIDDCSTDNTLEILESYKDLNLVIIKNEKNMTAGYCRNKAFDIAKGVWLYGLDSDDWFISGEIDKHLDNLLIIYKDYDIVYNDVMGNNGLLSNKNFSLCANHTYFVKREFQGSIRGDLSLPGYHIDIGLQLKNSLLKNNPKLIYAENVLFYRYNYPRIGSAIWNWEHKIGV